MRLYRQLGIIEQSQIKATFVPVSQIALRGRGVGTDTDFRQATFWESLPKDPTFFVSSPSSPLRAFFSFLSTRNPVTGKQITEELDSNGVFRRRKMPTTWARFLRKRT